MEYPIKNFSVLLTEEYGGEECNLEEGTAVSRLLNAKFEEFNLVTSEDTSSMEEFQCFTEMINKYLKPIKSIDAAGAEYQLIELRGIKVVVTRYPFDIIFFKLSEQEKFESILKKYNVHIQ